MLYPINEIFYSIQGEGFHTGKPAVFIRLAGCNLNCQWCDTDYSVKTKMNAATIAYEANALFPIKASLKFVVITGGEPTIHDLHELLTELKKYKMYIAIETNGTYPDQLRNLSGLIDWITISPKVGTFFNSALMKGIEEASEIKIVLDGIINPNLFELHILDKFERGLCFIQPCSEDFEPAVKFVLERPKWRLSIQIQKVVDVR